MVVFFFIVTGHQSSFRGHSWYHQIPSLIIVNGRLIFFGIMGLVYICELDP